MPKAKLVSVLLPIFIFLVGYFCDIDALKKSSRLARQNIFKVNFNILSLEKACDNEKQIKQSMFLLEAKYQAALLPFAKHFEWAEILRELALTAANYHVKINELEPKKIYFFGILKAYPMQLQIIGEYNELRAFLEAILNHEFFIFSQSMCIKPIFAKDISTTKLVLTTELTAIKFNGVAKLPLQLRTPQKTFFVPNLHNLFFADAAAKKSISPNLEAWSSTDLKYLGKFTFNQKTHAVVIDPLGFIYHLTVGDKVGFKHSKIVAIHDEAIITENSSDNIY